MRKRVIWLIIVVLLANALIPNFIYATDLEVNTQSFQDVMDGYSKDAFDEYKNNSKATVRSENGSKVKKVTETMSLASTLATGCGTLLLWPVALVSLTMTVITRGTDNFLIKNNQVTKWDESQSSLFDDPDGSSVNWFTIEDTVFNQIDLFNAEYFNLDKNTSEANNAIKQSVASFYYVMKVIAVVLQLAMLIYLGIRMAVSTIASEIARYKDMLKDWLVSMILIFAMPYIISLINMLSGSIINLFYTIKSESGFEKSIMWQAVNLLNITSGWSYVAIVLMYVVMTFYQAKFFVMYFYRLLSMGFLIVISPLITVTYSATRTKITGKGGRAGAFSNWLEEYMVNAFIQPIHAGIYLVFIISANKIFEVAPFLAVIFFMALSRAEKIVKNIFNFRGRESIHSMSEYVKFPGQNGKKK